MFAPKRFRLPSRRPFVFPFTPAFIPAEAEVTVKTVVAAPSVESKRSAFYHCVSAINSGGTVVVHQIISFDEKKAVPCL